MIKVYVSRCYIPYIQGSTSHAKNAKFSIQNVTMTIQKSRALLAHRFVSTCILAEKLKMTLINDAFLEA